MSMCRNSKHEYYCHDSNHPHGGKSLPPKDKSFVQFKDFTPYEPYQHRFPFGSHISYWMPDYFTCHLRLVFRRPLRTSHKYF